ncbi:FAD-dependent oxidoreductase [Paenibacillus sp. NPDC058177]|uniref:FAD-dependent oxidoreductase n=1 Tax=Paenibacillus sp. NPDC058177 TaxID=3346369 RepID=UPI0036DB37C1
MPSWTKGRVALVGDAGYCASPAAGMGGPLAIDGAAALADAFQKNHGNFELAPSQQSFVCCSSFLTKVPLTAGQKNSGNFPSPNSYEHSTTIN